MSRYHFEVNDAGEIADLKDRLEQQEALMFELMGGEGDPFE